jgi:predicted DNA-binding transcriptional regulator AlpA
MNINRTDLLLEIDKIIESKFLMGPKEFLTTKEAHRYLGVSRTTLINLRNKGLIESKVIGVKKVVYIKKSIDEFVRNAKSSYDTLCND